MGWFDLPELRQQLARNGRAMAESLTWDGCGERTETTAVGASIATKCPTTPYTGSTRGLKMASEHPFDYLGNRNGARDWKLLRGGDGKQLSGEPAFAPGDGSGHCPRRSVAWRDSSIF